MSQILSAIANATRDLLRLKIIWIMVWPILTASLLWILIGWLFRDFFAEFIFLGFAELGMRDWLDNQAPGWLAYSLQWLIHILFFIPLVIITTLIITAIFSMPALIHHVAKRRYPRLKRESGGTITGSLINALYATLMYILIWVITLPLWAFGAGLMVPFIAAAFLNQQLFRYDALSEHATHAEIKQLLASSRLPLWTLGLLTGFLQYVPVVNFFAPVLTALAFIHYELARLEKNRFEAARKTVNDAA
ncbi:Etoposide-induced protein 2.4 (EI24) [Nitrosomonas sp. Nm51]|uniref:EI24 domain-containing protein n=1 Tax=Nitrosomonas sp. Nm51 TaxID=133720 RepID=UPI0008C26D9A|nr:EI24 domain-containing protein [Nitrosomonas sp. Nm51]SEQ79347.1 Etoposide-induced protein 2.4 (EI24) [Nitrosomonas sp. Nm51]